MKIKKGNRAYIRRSILGLFVLFFLMQIISAVETEIKVKTMPNHEVQLTTSKANTVDFSVIESFKNNSDEYGDVSFISYSNDPEINIVVYIKKDNVKIIGPEKFLNKPTGEPLYLKIAPAWFEFIETPTNETNISENQTIENLTINETIEEIQEQPEQEEDKISQTGSAVSGEETSQPKKTIFYVIGVGILLIGGLVIFGIMRKSKSFRSKGKKREEDAEEIVEEIEEEERSNEKKKRIIDDVEKKMKEVEGEIEQLKDKEDKD